MATRAESTFSRQLMRRHRPLTATILSQLHRFSRSKERVLIVDKLSMISLATFAHLAEGLFIGRVFVVVGDPYQISPIGSNTVRWQKLVRSDFLHDMCNGLCVTLRKFRRRQTTADPLVFLPGDFVHFTQVGSLYPEVGGCEDPTSAIQQARLWYPYANQSVDTTLCVTNKQRLLVNERENRRLAPVGSITSIYEGADPRAQTMRIWPGLHVHAGGTDRKLGLRNALSHVVESVSAEWCTLARDSTRLTVPTSQVASLFRLTHALTIDSSQSLTLQGRLLILEADHRHFSLRRLIVALERSPSRDLINLQ